MEVVAKFHISNHLSLKPLLKIRIAARDRFVTVKIRRYEATRQSREKCIFRDDLNSRIGTSYHIKHASQQPGQQWVHVIRNNEGQVNNKGTHS
jgi:hypothetical protein